MQAFAAALSSPHVSALRKLDVTFRGDQPSPAVAEVGMFSQALSSGHLRRLEELRVGGLWVIEEVRALCVGLGSGRLPSLHLLRLLFCRLGPDGGRALSEVLIAEKAALLEDARCKVLRAHRRRGDGTYRGVDEPPPPSPRRSGPVEQSADGESCGPPYDPAAVRTDVLIAHPVSLRQ
mmetsp:Transcript_40518/g.79886  ORF Transcript_40518/g.79886 Transcript_40518/m.79886 type:complete len:178 (+) Transcript_40518:2-535(+)